MRAYAFLGAAQFGYQADVVEQLRARGVDVDPLVEGSLDDLEAIAADGRALLFLCGLPYTRLRDVGFAVEPLVAPAIGDGPPTYTSTLLGRRGDTAEHLTTTLLSDGPEAPCVELSMAWHAPGPDEAGGWRDPVMAARPDTRDD